MEFNNGFLISIGLFIEHKYYKVGPIIDKKNDLRLYGATDHLYDMEIPESLPKKLKVRIDKARRKAFSMRLAINSVSDTEALFEEFENILAEIDRQIFKTKKIEIIYR